MIRISKLANRCVSDYEAELAFVHYLAENGAAVADVIPSKNGSFLEIIEDDAKNEAFVVSMFEWARGDQLAAHGYCYQEGALIEEYWYNSGKTLGKIHALAKTYIPSQPRFDFFDQYNEAYFDTLIPDELACPQLGTVGHYLKQTLNNMLATLRGLPKSNDNYGLVHFDYSDGNYNIDYNTGQITVFDFENC